VARPVRSVGEPNTAGIGMRLVIARAKSVAFRVAGGFELISPAGAPQDVVRLGKWSRLRMASGKLTPGQTPSMTSAFRRRRGGNAERPALRRAVSGRATGPLEEGWRRRVAPGALPGAG